MENDCAAPARVGERTVPGAGAERAQPMKESRKRSFPRPRGGQDAFRGRSFGGSAVFPPQVLRQGGGSCPPAAKRVARLWAPPAPSRRASRGSAGGGFPGFADFTTWDRSATALEHLARNIEFRGSSRRFFRDYLPDTKILPPPDPRGCRALNPACLAPRATLAETFVPKPARAEPCNAPRYKPRACAFPGEPRSPAPASGEAVNFCETPHALPP